ncbi:MAG: FecR family protein [Pedobacter sp.]|nr:MAG: FecR family protein [Pedobacter sp.]
MTRDKFIELLSKKHSTQLNPEELEVFEQEIEKNDAHRELAHKVEQYFNVKQNPVTSIAKLDLLWAKIKDADNVKAHENFKISRSKGKLIFSFFAKIAATVILVVGISIASYKLLNTEKNNANDLNAKNEKVFKVLDDGTRVWLNKGAVLTYNREFGKEKRDITLKGEAYFDVVKSVVPLIIHAGKLDVEVKGTAFNVDASPHSESISITLLRGAVEVRDRQDLRKKVLLKPNQKLVYKNNITRVNFLNANILLKETEWTADTLSFNKEKLEDLVLKLQKKYDLRIEIHSAKLKDKRFSGTFINESIQQVLEALKLSYPLTYTIQNRLVIIRE